MRRGGRSDAVHGTRRQPLDRRRAHRLGDAEKASHAVIDAKASPMASAPTHALIGAAIGLVALTWVRPECPRLRRSLPSLSAFAAVLPDADVIMHAWVAYSHPFGHRGAFHSAGFYALAAAGAAFAG